MSLSNKKEYDFSIDFASIEKHIPVEDNELMPGVKWGHYCQLYTPAFWKYMYLTQGHGIDQQRHQIGSNLQEEIVACLLGGYGMPSELGMLAFKRLKEDLLIVSGVPFSKIQRALSTPFLLDNGEQRKYRFYNQKSKFVYDFLNRSDLNCNYFDDDISFRNWLTTINGIGLKTASWITRNHLQSENVAILDVHVLRAGRIIGFFDQHVDVSKKYLELEYSYICFCRALEVRPSNMDAIIWNFMKRTNKLALKVLSYS